jgi:hypothetical protein
MKLKSISRIDTHNTHGWYVRVKYRGIEYRKLFSDNKYGNKLSSLVAAKKHRDELEARLGKPRTDRLVIAVNKRNSSGVIGVRRREFPAFEVQASIKPGKIKKVIIPITNGDEQAAFHKACRVRQQLIQKYYLDDNRIDF